MTRFSLALTALVAGLLALAPAAPAQEGMRPDADSPAGVEYQLPLDRAREEASGGGGSGGGGSGGEASKGGGGGGAPLFGEGVTRVASGGEAAGAASPDGAGGGGDGEASSDDGEGGGASAELQRASLDAPSGSGGGSSGLGAGWIVLAVLVAGAALGLLLRRGLRDPSG